MLRIRHEDLNGANAVLHLDGNLVAEWADLLERVCAEAGRSGRRVVIDLAGVVFIGRSGFQALGRLSRSGVGITGASPLIADILESDGVELEP